jgi:hypothetical protein
MVTWRIAAAGLAASRRLRPLAAGHARRRTAAPNCDARGAVHVAATEMIAKSPATSDSSYAARRSGVSGGYGSR